MTELNLPASAGKRAGVGRLHHRMPRTDMTPMVDLAFLLITFFVMTAQMQQPAAMPLAMPKDGPSMPVGDSESITVLLGSDRDIYYYEGMANGVARPVPDGVSGCRDIFIKKQKMLDSFKGRDRLTIIIKPMASSNYRLLIDVLDEVKLSGVSRFVVVDPDKNDLAMLK